MDLETWCKSTEYGGQRAVLWVPSSPLFREIHKAVLRTWYTVLDDVGMQSLLWELSTSTWWTRSGSVRQWVSVVLRSLPSFTGRARSSLDGAADVSLRCR